jgi:hypothetical protein
MYAIRIQPQGQEHLAIIPVPVFNQKFSMKNNDFWRVFLNTKNIYVCVA